MNKIYFILVLITAGTTTLFGQDSLALDKPYEHSVKKATIWSACIPGAGQIYNEIGYRRIPGKKHRAWWKVPIIYGGLGVTGYIFYDNFQQSQLIKEEVLYRRENGINSNLHPELSIYEDEDDLINGFGFGDFKTPGFNDYAKTRDYMIFAFIGIWGLNVVEALVDAHFVTFDVSPDLSFYYRPVLLDYKTPGISLTLGIN